MQDVIALAIAIQTLFQGACGGDGRLLLLLTLCVVILDFVICNLGL